MSGGFWQDLASTFQETAFSGPMLLAVPVAIIAGVVSFASPCVIPLLPGYFAFVTGMSGASTGQRSRAVLLTGVALFVLGFSAVFVLLGVAFGSLGVAIRPWLSVVMPVMGALVVLMGLSFLGWIPGLQRERRLHLAPRQGLLGAHPRHRLRPRMGALHRAHLGHRPVVVPERGQCPTWRAPGRGLRRRTRHPVRVDRPRACL